MVNQISVFLENRAGQLVNATSTLSDNGIDIKAVNIAETADYGILRLVCSDANKALSLLKEAGYTASMSPVVAVAVPDVVGGLNQLLKAVANESIDVEYMYSIFSKEAGLAYMILRVEDPEKVSTLLKDKGFIVAEEGTLSV